MESSKFRDRRLPPRVISYLSPATTTSRGRIEDPDGGFTDYNLTIANLPRRGFATGGDRGGSDIVKLYDQSATETLKQRAFRPAYTQGVRTASADFNGEGIEDVVVGTGPGGSALIQIIDGSTGNVLFRLNPFEESFTGGVFVAAGDLNGDGVPELVVTPDEGGGPRVCIFNGKDFGQIADYLGIDDENFRGGARPAVGDLNGDGFADLLIAAGFGDGPRIAIFDGITVTKGNPTRLMADFFLFEQSLRNGVYIASGDLNGDGSDDLVAGAGPHGGPRVFVLDGHDLMNGNQTQLVNFFGGDPSNRSGVRVTTAEVDGDDRAEIVIGSGVGAGPKVTVYAGKTIPIDGTPVTYDQFDIFPGYTGGIFVG